LILDPTADMKVMQEEIFGPVLPIMTYADVAEAIAHVNANPTHTVSGGATVNDVIFHVSMEDLPFGGIGPSGMGAYHGRDGFVEFSHRKSVYRQIGSELLAMMRPPYGAAFKKQVAARIRE
jgi:coniferyl-aldehyde dehydrogenase